MKLPDIILDLFGPSPEAAPPAPPAAAKPAPPPPPPPPAKPSRAPGERDEREVLAVLNRAGGTFEGVRFTSNRRIMASVGRDRATVRLNVAFASAPVEVLAAVAVLFSPARGRKKQLAKQAVQKFINEIIPPPAAPARRRRRRVHPADRIYLERLQEEFDRTNREHFRGQLPRVPMYLSRVMRRRNGHFTSDPLEIVISWHLCTHGAAGEAEQTVRHEMIHLWQYMTGAPVDHGPAFRRMAHRLDVHPRAARPVKWKGR